MTESLVYGPPWDAVLERFVREFNCRQTNRPLEFQETLALKCFAAWLNQHFFPSQRATPELARQLLKIRDAFASGDTAEAYHQLYGIIDPLYINPFAWEWVEKLAVEEPTVCMGGTTSEESPPRSESRSGAGDAVTGSPACLSDDTEYHVTVKDDTGTRELKDWVKK